MAGFGGRAVAVGGHAAMPKPGAGVSGTVSTVEAYQVATDRWQTLSSMPTARESFGMAVMGESATFIAVAGKYMRPRAEKFEDRNRIDSVTEQYRPAQDQWTTLVSMPRCKTGCENVGGVHQVGGALGMASVGGGFAAIAAGGLHCSPLTWYCATFRAIPTLRYKGP